VLDGEKLTRWIRSTALSTDEYKLNAEALTLEWPGDTFTLEIETSISPETNTELSGLYMSSGRFCTQCEAEGFRRITFYPDRPDVLAPFHVRVEAEKASYPHLLSNGNPTTSGDLEGGRHFAEWTDPHPKSYLRSSAGIRCLEDSFTTPRAPVVAIYVRRATPPARPMMLSLKNFMLDEDVFGRNTTRHLPDCRRARLQLRRDGEQGSQHLQLRLRAGGRQDRDGCRFRSDRKHRRA
jgi:aminopeptidase N